MKVLYTDGGEQFIFSKLKDIYNCKDIIIKYVVPYMHKTNGLAKRG